MSEVRNSVCPVCGSDNIEGDGVDIFSDGAEQECWCCDCGSSWYAYYTFSHNVVIVDE